MPDDFRREPGLADPKSRASPDSTPNPGSPFLLLGFALGVLAVSPFATYWVYAWIVPLLLAGLVTTAAGFAGRQTRRVLHVAEGVLAATLFAVAFPLVALAVLFVSGR